MSPMLPSDLQLIYYVRDALLEVTDGRETYEELVGYLQPKRNLNSHDAAQLVAILKALAGVVSYIDFVHHGALIFSLERMSLWNLATYKNYDAADIMDALMDFIVSLAALKGMYIDWCLERLVRHFTAPKHVIDFLKNENGVDRKNKVLSRVHAALKQIYDLVPLAPMRLTPIVVQNIPKRYDVTEHEIVMYVENMLKLESGDIGEIVGSTMLPALVDKLIELDVEIGWDGKMHEDAKCIFEMELFEDIAEFADDDEKYHSSMCASELLNRNNLQGNKVVEKIDSLIVLTFLHLESCQSSGRLTEVFDILLASFKRTVLNTYKSKFTQFVMFYACALDPEQCGVKFAMVLRDMFESDLNPPITRMSAVAYLASYLSRAKFLSSALVADIIQSLVYSCFAYCNKLHDSDMNPEAHQVFYSGCQAIMYILCFRMKSLMEVPRLKMKLIKMPMLQLWEHKLNPLKVCLPSVVEEFLIQAKTARLFMSAELFVFEDLLESDLSKAFGGMDRLDMFFPFDPCLLKKSESYIRPHFVRWSRVKTTYDDDEDSDSGSEASDDDDFVDRNANDMIDDDMVGSVGAGLDFDPDMNKMSITPKSFKYGFKEQMQWGHTNAVES